MRVLLVSYDLKGPNRDYGALHFRIRLGGKVLQRQRSVWVIESELDARQAYALIEGELRLGDSVLVIDITDAPVLRMK